MIGRAVTLHADDVVAGAIRVQNTYVHTILRDTDLWVCCVSRVFQPLKKPPLEVAVRVLTRLASNLETTRLEDGSPVEADAHVRFVPLDDALAATRAGVVADVKTEVALRRLAERDTP